jgi:hypothetical protein
MAAKSGDSARARLIKTRRGTWIDESLIPAARRECLEILRIASQAVGEGMEKRVRNVGQHVEEDSSLSDLFSPNGYRARVSDELEALHTEFLKYQLPEEESVGSCLRSNTRRENMWLLRSGSVPQGACVPRRKSLRRHVAPLLGLQQEAADWQASLCRHGAMLFVRAGVVITGERRRSNAAMRALRTPDGIASGPFRASAHVLF